MAIGDLTTTWLDLVTTWLGPEHDFIPNHYSSYRSPDVEVVFSKTNDQTEEISTVKLSVRGVTVIVLKTAAPTVADGLRQVLEENCTVACGYALCPENRTECVNRGSHFFNQSGTAERRIWRLVLECLMDVDDEQKTLHNVLMLAFGTVFESGYERGARQVQTDLQAIVSGSRFYKLKTTKRED